MIALAASPWAADTTLVYLGMLPAGIGLLIGTRAALIASVLTPAGMVVGLLLHSDPVAGALFMTALAAAVGASSVRGWHAVGAYLGPQTAFALIGVPIVQTSSDPVIASHSLSTGVWMAVFVLFGGLWATLVGRAVISGVHLSAPKSVDARAAGYFAAALALLVGAATYIAMSQLSDGKSWWAVLALFVIVQPGYAASMSRAAARVGGTIGGAAAAAALGAAVGGYGLATTALALVLSGAAAVAYMSRPYWVYALLLTPAVILQTAHGRTAIVHADVQRVLFTLAAGAAATLLLSVGHLILTSRRP